MKTCQSCYMEKEEEDFPIRKDKKNILRPYCGSCANDIVRARYKFHKENNPFLHKATRARSRSQALKVPFDLDKDYLESIWTGKCPVFGIEIFLYERSRSDSSAAELDRFIPKLGYIKGNVSFISRKANQLKSDASLGDLRKLVEWMETYENQ